MALSNYTNISSKLEEWLNREGMSSIATNAEDFITLAQRTITRDVRVPPMEVMTDLTVTSGRATIPPAMLDVKEVIAFDGCTAWPVYRDTFAGVKNHRLQNAAGPRVFDTVAGNFEFGPQPSSGVTVTLVYYQELNFISPTVPENWFSKYAPELILYAALAEAAVFIKDTELEAKYSEKYDKAREALRLQKDKAEHAGNLQVTPR